MIRNLFLSAFRALRKNAFFSSLNILGLAIGMSVFLLIAQYVYFETSYEKFIRHDDRIYRVALTTYVNNELVFSSAENYPGVGPALVQELPEVQSYARLYNLGYKNNVIITNEDAKPEPVAFKHRRFLYADSSFLPMMGYTMIAGDPKTALAQPNSAVISQTYATLYFGESDPIGKSLRMQDDDFANELVTVTGVVEDLPANTHLKFDVLFSYKTLLARGDWAPRRYHESWQRKDMYTFVLLHPEADVQGLESKFPAIIDKYNPALKERNQKDILSLQPLHDIHLTSSLAEEPEANGDERIVLFMGLIGVFVLVIAWINYINLATAKAMERANEVGVRKVMGAFKAQLVSQFMVEAILINLISLIAAFGLVALVLPSFNQLSGLSLTFGYLMQPWFFAVLTGVWLVGSILSGFYPAFVLSSFKPVVVLKGKMRNSRRGLVLRKSLVVLQFVASIALISGTLIVYDQLNYMMDQDIGMNVDQVLVIERPGIAQRDREAFNSSIDVFRNELSAIPAVGVVTTSITIPGKQREYKAVVKKYGGNDDDAVAVRFNSMDYNFISVFQMKLLAGRAFSEDFTNDRDTSAIITESASRLLGFEKPEDAIGQTLAIPQFRWNPIVVGVVNDYHQVSLKNPLDPTLFYCTPYGGEFYSMPVKTTALPETIQSIKAAWTKAFPGNPFEYFFLDDYFNQQYENEMKFGKLFTTFSGFAILVGCIGLFGLSAFTANQRTKEIGIRKVLGSTVRGIFILLSKEYLKLILVSLALAVPLVYFVMSDWVQSFPYRISIQFTVFLIAGISVLVIALLTISYQTLRAAHTNPVNSLRYE